MSDYQREKNQTVYYPHKKNRGGHLYHPKEGKTRQKQENKSNESTH